jgi:hydrogenase expression/formation protein HypE
MAHSALLVVDMQNDLCRDARRGDKVMAMLPFLTAAINAFADAGQLIIYTCFSLPEHDEQFRRFGDRYCIAGTKGAEIIPELQPLLGPVIHKRKHSAFFETELNSLLQKAGVRNLYLAGLQTHICILTTAADANFRGFRAIAIEECVLSSQDEKHHYALDWIAHYVGEVLTLDQSLAELNRHSERCIGPNPRIHPGGAGSEANRRTATSPAAQPARISLSDGAGGAATLRLIKDEILSRFANPALNPLEDSSWVNVGTGQVIVTADAYVVDPPVFPGGDIGSLSVSGTVNDLLASGARPLFLTLSLVIGEGFPLDTLRHILDSTARAADAGGVQIVAGDTKVVERKPETLFIHTSGIGLPLMPGKDYAVSKAQVGDHVVVTGTIGDHGFALLSYREGLGFEHRVESDCAPLSGLLLPILKEFDAVRSMRDPTRGGLLGVLADIAESAHVDLHVAQECIPVKTEVAFGCDMLGIDPLELVNEGKMVLVVGASQSKQLLSRLRSHPLGADSRVIGKVRSRTAGEGRLLFETGSGLIIKQRPEGISIPRLC